MADVQKKPFLMFLTLQEFFGDILKRNSDGEMSFKLGECYILVISRDVVTSVGIKSRDYTDTSEFQSRYENVEFLMTLVPKPSLMEYIGTTGTDQFMLEYYKMLEAKAPMSDMISICDCVVNRGIPVFMVASASDMNMIKYPKMLRDFIRDEFGLNGYTMDDIERKSIDIVYDIGNVDEIKKSIDAHIDLYLKQYDIEYFFNTLTDDMENAYREILSKYSETELRALAKERKVLVSRRYTKDEIIEKIISDIKREGE